MTEAGRVVHLHAGGISVLMSSTANRIPEIAYWGADLGELAEPAALVSALERPVGRGEGDVAARFALVPQESEAFLGRPGLCGGRGERDWSPKFAMTAIAQPAANAVRVEAVDQLAGLQLACSLRVSESGVLLLSHQLTNVGADTYTLQEFSCILPVPARAGEIFDLTGRWALERQPQRHAATAGSYVRELRHGRTGFDAPLLLAAGTPGFANRIGEVWSVHLAWSGNARIWFEDAAQGQRSLGAAELLTGAGKPLKPGQTYHTPELYGVYSAAGLDGISSRLHRHLRQRPRHPRRDRPVVFNTWEAVYFGQNLRRLSELADLAASVGAERFVLDDGWFAGRRNDSAGLGDWDVDPRVWPTGLAPLIEHVRATGMDFGLWVEPEMINPDSELYREHPDWVLKVAGHQPITWRNQLALDLSRPAVFDHLLAKLDDLLASHDIAYLKWDHNRDIFDAGGAEGQPAGGDTVRAVYRLLDELRRRHPDVEIESCSSGGARVDLAILQRTDRVWASDSIDALDRQQIQRWTSLLLPLELIGAHVGAPTAHITGRSHSLALRAVTAMFASLGIEWDISAASPQQRDALAGYIALYKRFRPLLHTGELVHPDWVASSSSLQGVVSTDGAEALFGYVQLSSPCLSTPLPVLLPGLEPDAHYLLTQVRLPDDGDPQTTLLLPRLLSGRALAQAGVALPALKPETCVLLHALRQP